METAFLFTSGVGGFGIAWLFWRAIQPLYLQYDGQPGKTADRMRSAMVWATMAMWPVGVFISGCLLRLMG